MSLDVVFSSIPYLYALWVRRIFTAILAVGVLDSSCFNRLSQQNTLSRIYLHALGY